jgi:hypothetical protein
MAIFQHYYESKSQRWIHSTGELESCRAAQMQESLQVRRARLAKEIARKRHTDAIANVEDRRLIIGIESETDNLPVGEVRKLWAPDALRVKDFEIVRCEELYRPRFLEACKRIAGRLRQ